MLTLAFVDTGAWIALLVPRDQHHVRAREFFRSMPRDTRLLTSDYVLSETVTWLSYHGWSSTALRLKSQIEASEQQTC